MKLELENFQAVAANLPVGGEVCDLAQSGLATHGEAELAIAPLIQEVGATSIAEIDRLMAQLQEAKNYLQSERKRIEQEAARYTNLTQMASASAKMILDAISQWHPVSQHP
jgi:DNA repair exonuclease SbcCD ATPase subunit